MFLFLPVIAWCLNIGLWEAFKMDIVMSPFSLI
ncbi:chlorhexidine efflux transporter [Psychrobacter faecalis]